jgi:hypothetical protein
MGWDRGWVLVRYRRHGEPSHWVLGGGPYYYHKRGEWVDPMSGHPDCQLETAQEQVPKRKMLHFSTPAPSHYEIPYLPNNFPDSPACSEVRTRAARALLLGEVWPLRCGVYGAITTLRMVKQVPRTLLKKEERKWARLQLAIPVFVRTRDRSGKDSLEFATAINISPGGALVAVRRSLPKSTLVSLEIPSAPIGPANGLKTSSRIMQAKAVWVTHLDDYHLLGLKFARSLSTDSAAVLRKRLGKPRSAV